MRDLANKIIDTVKANGASEALFVGGCVRDQLLGIPSKDIDIEVFGIPFDALLAVLAKNFKNVKAVGEAFGVIKVNELIDVSVPRRENKVGIGHKGFDVQTDHTLLPAEAALRRDFTINSIMQTRDGQFIDPHGGIADIERKVLRATSAAFSEDPLRVLRAMQFAGRFGFSLAEPTVQLCQDISVEFNTLAKERIFEEWWKWATKSVKPSNGLNVLVQTGWIEHFPELKAIVGVPQDESWHPEGPVDVHTAHVCDAAADIARRDGLDELQTGTLVLAALCHDFGKATTTAKNEAGRWIAHGHAEAGVEPTRTFLESIGAFNSLFEEIGPLVEEHMAHAAIEEKDLSHRIVRRLATRLAPANIKTWSRVCEADASGRPPLPKVNPVEAWVALAESMEIVLNKPKPILMGRHLLDIGFKPGPEIGRITKLAFEQQLDGTFTDIAGALNWAKEAKLI